MKKFLALVAVRNKEFYRDKATLMWTFAFPFLVLLGFAYGYSGREEPLLKVGISPKDALASSQIHDFALIPQIQLVGYEDSKVALQRLEKHQLDIYAHVSSNTLQYWINTESPKATLAERLLKSGVASGTILQKQELTGKKLRYADWLVPGLVGMNLMFASLFGVGYVIVRYRKNGVLKRLRATPLTAFEFLFAQVISRTILLVGSTTLTILGARLLIGFQMAGSWIDLWAFIAIGSTSLIALGMLVAARISSEEVAEGVLNVMTWPMIFLSGVWFSLEGASPWVTSISKVLPLTHVVNGLRAIMIDGASITSLAPQLFALSIGAFILLAIGSLIFKWR